MHRICIILKQKPDTRLDSFCELIRNSEDARKSLRILKERFNDYIFNDAIRRMAGLPDYYQINKQLIDDAMESNIDKPGVIGINETPVPIQYINELAKSLPQLPFNCSRSLRETENELLEQNLRLMLFYNNCMRFWKESDGLNHGKKKVIEAISQNIKEIVLKLPPSKMIDLQLSNSHEIASFDIVANSIT